MPDTPCKPDPRDDLDAAVQALTGLRDLLADVRQFDCTRPLELAELLDLVRERLARANAGIGEFVPRGWQPPE